MKNLPPKKPADQVPTLREMFALVRRWCLGTYGMPPEAIIIHMHDGRKCQFPIPLMPFIPHPVPPPPPMPAEYLQALEELRKQAEAETQPAQ